MGGISSSVSSLELFQWNVPWKLVLVAVLPPCPLHYSVTSSHSIHNVLCSPQIIRSVLCGVQKSKGKFVQWDDSRSFSGNRRFTAAEWKVLLGSPIRAKQSPQSRMFGLKKLWKWVNYFAELLGLLLGPMFYETRAQYVEWETTGPGHATRSPVSSTFRQSSRPKCDSTRCRMSHMPQLWSGASLGTISIGKTSPAAIAPGLSWTSSFYCTTAGITRGVIY